MIRRNRGGNAKVEAKKDVVKSRTISRKTLVTTAILSLAAVMFFGFTESAIGLGGEPPDLPAQVDHSAKIEALYAESQKYKDLAHKHRHTRGAGHRYHAPLPPVTESLRTETKRAAIWLSIAKMEYRQTVKWRKELLAERAKWERANRDFHYALKLASEHYGVAYSWLHACAHSEGHIHGRRTPGGPIDPFVMNHGGSGAGGWMQFMEPTFYGNLRGANPLPRKYHKWNSKLGQAYVAAYMFKIGQSRQWTGPGCN